MAQEETPKRTRVRAGHHGVGQLTLVEHALCPLDAKTALAGTRHECDYFFTDASRHRRRARVRIDSPAGLSANDEFFLWGLLALTLAQPDATGDFYATPHFCLRQLGCLATGSKGGKNYNQFRQAIGRLSAVRYQNDRFYDPIRKEHRAVSFGFFSYSLPLDPKSSRAWRIVWDPLFFEVSQAVGCHVAFDLETYRKLDCASRRLFLLLKKVFWRRTTSPQFDVRHLAVDVLGYQSSLTTRTLTAKVKRCFAVLLKQDIVRLPQGSSLTDCGIVKRAKGEYLITFHRGSYFDRKGKTARIEMPGQSPLVEPLRSIGFEPAAIARILSRFRSHDVQVWSDVTLAALERKGRSFFQRSPQAFFMDSIQQAAKGLRTPPDWFCELQKAEERSQAEQIRRKRKQPEENQDGILDVDDSERAHFEKLVQEMSSQFRAAGQPPQTAKKNAERFAKEHLHRNRSTKRYSKRPLGNLFQS